MRDGSISIELAISDTGLCWLCRRPLGRRIEWHHPRPRSRGGREVVPVHPICHRAMHVSFDNVALARLEAEGRHPSREPALQSFLKWVAGKPPDFHAPTRSRRTPM